MPAAGIPTPASIRGRLGFYAVAAEGVSAEELDTGIDAVIERLRQDGVTQQELDRARASYIAEFVYTSDSQSRMARHYGWRLADRHDRRRCRAMAGPAETRDRRGRCARSARKYLVDNNSVTGYLLPAPGQASPRVASGPMRQPTKASLKRDGARPAASSLTVAAWRGSLPARP